MAQHDHKDTLGYWLHHMSALHRRVFTADTKKFGLTAEQYGLLFQLRDRGGISQKQLAELMHKDQATTGKIVEKLEAKRLIYRLPDPSDRRAFLLYITEEGKEVLRQLIPLAETVEAQAWEGVSTGEVELFKQIMRKIHDNLYRK